MAGEELAESVISALDQLQIRHQKSTVSYQGSVVVSSRFVRERFTEVIKEKAPESSVIVPQYEPIMGAAILGFEAKGWDVAPALLKQPEGEQWFSNNT